jgi:hypothetical protein
MRCPRCGGYMRREPAVVTCICCGRWIVVLDATVWLRYSEGAARGRSPAKRVGRPVSGQCASTPEVTFK